MLKKLLSGLFFAGIAAAGIVYYVRYRGDFHLMTSVSPGVLAALSCLYILITLCSGLQLKILMDHYKLDASFRHCFGISRASSFINLFFPSAVGSSFKAVYLKNMLKFRYSSFIASMGITTVMKIMIYALIALLLLLMPYREINMFLIMVSGLIFSVTLFFLVLGHRLKRLDVTSAGYAAKVADEWQKIREDRRTIVRLLIVGLLLFLATGLNTYLSFMAFSVPISLNASGTIAAFTTITGLLNIIPGNLGVREAIIVLISRSHGIGINESVHAAALGRLIQVIWTVVLALSVRYSLFHKSNDSSIDSSNKEKQE